MYDTSYHLNKEGVRRNTGNILSVLKAKVQNDFSQPSE